MTPKNILFVCSRNRLRSPTAERIFSARAGLEVKSAGTSPDAENPVTEELIEWADIIFVMEKAHRTRIQRRFSRAIKDKLLICLDIPDNYEFMKPALVNLLETRLARHLPRLSGKIAQSC